MSVDVIFRVDEYTTKGCRKLSYVTRVLPGGATAKDFVWAVLNGPTPAERSTGVRSVFGKGGEPTDAAVSVDPASKVVIVDFASVKALGSPPAGCGGGEIVWPLREALNQWDDTWQVSFRIMGDKVAFRDYLQSVS
jgi:hypothetical protein